MINMSDFEDKKGKTDWNAYHKAQEEAGERCPKCKAPIDWQTILNPERRQWVHEEPDNLIHGYQILPIDVPEAAVFLQ